MIKIENITIKNFLSVGAVTQSIAFCDKGLVLILGENLDQGGNGARNGVGKSTIIQALSYGLYDAAITPIKKDNMINKTNGKNMMISVDFSIDGTQYKIERGRRPNILKFYTDGIADVDEAQGENKNTQKEIEKLLDMSHDMFKNIVALSTYNQPFLFMRAMDQRAIIEELLGITLLSKKAETLKKDMNLIRTSVREEDIRLKTMIESNEGIKRTITQLMRKSDQFVIDHDASLDALKEAIAQLKRFDIDDELKKHKIMEEYHTKLNDKKILMNRKSQCSSQMHDYATRLERLTEDLGKAENNICPTCEQQIHDSNLTTRINDDINELVPILVSFESEFNEFERQLDDIVLPDVVDLYYNKIGDAYDHKQNLDKLKFQFKEEKKKTNSFAEQIISLNENALREIDYSSLNELKKVYSHQEFLHKLLTNKDSFIRKKIIDQNLSYLNSRISYYLNKLGLPHNVDFKSDLSVEIVLLGQEFDFGQLSRGQQNRLILAFSWAFRDVWESTGHSINLFFVDEMIDTGMDAIGVENTLEILKSQTRERGKDIFLISHKEELMNRVNDVLMVVLENGFTSYSIE